MFPRHKVRHSPRPYQTGHGCQALALGVPKGFGVKLPPGLAKRMTEDDPTTVQYQQVLKLALCSLLWLPISGCILSTQAVCST